MLIGDRTLSRDPFWATRRPFRFARTALSGSTGRRRAAMPGPVGLPVVGVMPRYSRDPYGYLRACAARYGDVFRLPLPLMDVVIANHPEHVSTIMNDREGHRWSMIGKRQEGQSKYFGTTLPAMEGAEFRERRSLMRPMFNKGGLANVSDTMLAEFVRGVDGWGRWADTGEVVDLQEVIAATTLPGFLRSIFSSTITDAEIVSTGADIQLIMDWTSALYLLCRPPNPVRVIAAILRLRKMIDRIVAHRMANPIEGSDILDLLVDARDPAGEPLSRLDLAAELMVMVAGGYETVAAGLSWTLGYLSRNQDATDRLVAEVDALGGALPTMADLGRLSWAKACFDEGLRLQSSPLNFRFAMEDGSIAGYPIPRGTLVAASTFVLHRDERWWPDAERYDPDRFVDKDLVHARPNQAFIPFGSGPHTCIGMGMAYMKAQFMLALIMQRYRVSVPASWEPRRRCRMITTMRDGLPVTLERRGAPIT